MRVFLLILFFLFKISFVFGQFVVDSTLNSELNNGLDIIKPNTLTTHPLGINVSRINHNFRIGSHQKCAFSVEISSGNVFLPYVKSYELTNATDRQISSGLLWHAREFSFDLNNVPSRTKEFFADGIIRVYNLKFDLPLNKHHELSFGIRSFSLDKGKYPFSVLTSDESIEWFHSNIAGGEDPFLRKYYGLNKAKISYRDENGNTLEIEDGDFGIAGVQVDYFYYPKLKINKKHHIYLNFGAHLGVNTSRYNPVADMGVSSSIIKKKIVQNRNILTFGMTSGILKQRFLVFGDRIGFSNKTLLHSFEGLVDYKKKLKNGNYFSYGLNYSFQTAYNKKKDFDYIVLTGQRVKTHWDHAFSHLYRNLESWNLIFTYTVKQFSYFVYLKEDIKVDNAPDLQTGFGFKWSFLR